MDFLSLLQSAADGTFEDAEDNPQLPSGVEPPTWAASTEARQAAETARQLKKQGKYAEAAVEMERAVAAGHPAPTNLHVRYIDTVVPTQLMPCQACCFSTFPDECCYAFQSR